MKRVKTILLAAVALVMLQGGVAHADHGVEDFYFDNEHHVADTWPNSGTESYCYDSEFFDQLGGAEETNMQATTELGFAQWRNNSDFNRVFDGNGECSGNVSIMASWASANVTKSGAIGETQKEEFCQEYLTGAASRVQYENLDPNVYGFTMTCDRDDNGSIDWFALVIDIKFDEWTWDNVAPTAGKPYSYWAAVTHEAGHATGWRGHWTGTGMCPNNGNHSTMCNDGYGFLHNFGGTANATIESHDIGEINQPY